MSDVLQTRGPNYNWKLEAEHLQQELETTRALLHEVDSSSERLVYDLEIKLALAKEALEDIANAGGFNSGADAETAREALEKLSSPSAAEGKKK